MTRNSSAPQSGSGDLSRTLELLWGTGERPSRGPKPSLTLDQIVTAAVAVADAEGLDAVSMRRLSTELGVGTMSLYRYIPGKAELVHLMLERVQGPSDEPPPEDAPGAGDWRGAMEYLARSFLTVYREHPWLLQVNQARPVLGPAALHGLELALTPLAGLPLSDPEKLSLIVAIQGYATGVARSQINAQEAERQFDISWDEFWQAQTPHLERAMASGAYPVVSALSEDTFSRDFDHFEFGLQRLLDGFEVLVAERSGE